MQISHKFVDKNTVAVELEGSFWREKSEQLNNYVAQYLQDPTIKHVNLHFGKVTEIDSRGVTSLVTVFQDFKNAGVRLLFCDLSMDHLKVFETLALDKVFNIQGH